MKKTLALCLALLMTLSVTVAATAETNVFGWEKPETTIVLDIFVAQDNVVLLEEQKVGMERLAPYLKDEFNIEAHYTFADGTADERLNLMLAANNYPAIVGGVSNTIKAKFLGQGKAQDLTDYVEQSPNLIKRLGDLKGMYASEDGRYYALPAEYGGLMDLPDYSAHLRYDEWLEIGSPEIKTPDDWFDAMMKILELHPTTPSGESRYSLSLYSQGAPVSWWTGYWGLKDGFKDDADHNLTYWAFTDEGKAMATFVNKIWRTGTMDPDSFVNTWDDERTKISQERVVALIGGWWIGYNAGHEIWSLTNPNWNENMRYFQVGFKAPEAEAVYATGKNLFGSTWTIATDKCTDVAGFMKWIDFAATDVGMALTSWGMPGYWPTYKDPSKEIAMWHITSPTEFYFDPVSKQQLIDEVWDYNEEGIFGVNQGQLQLSINRSRWDDGEYCSWGNQMWYSENKWKNIMFTNMAGTIYDATALKAIQTKPDDIMIIETAIADAWKQDFPLLIMTENDKDFEAAWKTLQEDLINADIDTYVKFREDNYKDNLEKMAK